MNLTEKGKLIVIGGDGELCNGDNSQSVCPNACKKASLHIKTILLF